MTKIKIIEWDKDKTARENRKIRLREIIKDYPCKCVGDCRQYYEDIYKSINEDDVTSLFNTPSELTKIIQSIPDLAKDENGKKLKDENGCYYILESDDEDDVFFNQLKDIFNYNKISIKEIRTIQFSVDRSICRKLIDLLEKQFKNIIEIHTRNISKNKKHISITYSTEIPKLKPSKKTGDYYYSPNDLMETLQAIKTELYSK